MAGFTRAESGLTYLTDILVANTADLLDIGGGLGNILQRVSGEGKLILLVLGDLDIDTLVHDDLADDLLADEVADLDDEVAGLGILLNVDVDWEMGVDVTHLVLEALGDTDDHVVDQGADSAEGGNVLASTVVELDVDDIALWVGEVDCQVGEVLLENTCEIVSMFRFYRTVPRHWMSCAQNIRAGKYVPLGPSTVTNLDLMVTLTMKGMKSASDLQIIPALYERPKYAAAMYVRVIAPESDIATMPREQHGQAKWIRVWSKRVRS